MKARIFTAAAAAALAAGFGARAGIVINGDFEAGGPVGFMSQYAYIAPAGQGSLYPETSFTVDTNPNNVHNLWASYGDHTSGKGMMLIVNGATRDGVTIWDQAGDDVAAHTDYVFSVWIASSYPVSPAQLEFTINGASIGAVTASATTGVWQEFSATWNSGADVTAALAIVDHNTDAYGNDFTLDDISLVAKTPEPATWALMIGGFGLAGAALRRRRLARA
jgi:hypothetical protein